MLIQVRRVMSIQVCNVNTGVTSTQVCTIDTGV